MEKFNAIEKQLLSAVADLESIPKGAVSVRENGKSVMRSSSQGITISAKTDKPGIDVHIASSVKNESVHIPVIMTQSGLKDLVYNDFYIEPGADVVIIAGCGIDNCGGADSRHDGVHTFHLAEGCKVKYVEKHLGTGVGTGGRILDPVTDIVMEKDSMFEMETVQLGGVTSSVRSTRARLKDGAKLLISERILTADKQTATTEFDVLLEGDGCSVDVVSRSVAQGESVQEFVSGITGKCRCFGHVECDGIMMDKAVIRSTPKISAEHIDASLMHEATIGKIAGEQLIKLETLGLSEAQAEAMIIKGFLA